MRIEYINTNGIKTKKSDRFKEILHYIKQNKCDIFGITETNINWKNGEIYRSLMKEAKRYTESSQTKIIRSDCTISWEGKYKPGGTVTIINGSFETKIANKQPNCPLGRWSSVTLGPLIIKLQS